ncbi:SRPBCC family protein [Massilia sp. S19_KUP03_FR1]|uniref:SRPBCC family protein n=1 Tax=Massilia sp. S19_KUP03_FR1 TaxID=3025503 RepID=UPI002FCD70E7
MNTTNNERFVIERSFDAPLAQVFAMWIQPDDLARWLPPAGFAMRFLRADLHQGGSTLFSMAGYGMTITARAEYEEIRSHDRIVYTQQFCDEHEQVMRHPMAPDWPATLRITVALREEAAGRTHVTLCTDVAGDATAEEIAAFVAGHASMAMGWSGSFAQLDAVLANA